MVISTDATARRDEMGAVDMPEEQHFKHLQSGIRYRVIRPFVDFDGIEHAAGECFVFTGAAFLPYEDGLTLFVAPGSGAGTGIRLQWRPESQGDVIDALEAYVEEIPQGT